MRNYEKIQGMHCRKNMIHVIIMINDNANFMIIPEFIPLHLNHR